MTCRDDAEMMMNIYFKCQHDLQRGAGIAEKQAWTGPGCLHPAVYKVSGVEEREDKLPTGYLLARTLIQNIIIV